MKKNIYLSQMMQSLMNARRSALLLLTHLEKQLFLAYHFPNNYFLSNMITLDDSGKEIGWLAISSKEEYEHAYAEAGQSLPSVVEIATLYFMNEMKRINEMCDTYIDRGDICYTVWDLVKSVDGRIVKDDREEK